MKGGRLIFADSSGLIAYLLRDDSFHEAAVRTVREHLREGGAFVTTNYVFDEVVTRIQRVASHAESVVAGEKILASTVIRRVYIGEDLEARAWKLYRKYQDKELSFTDVTCAALMGEMGIQVIFTFDGDFRKVGLEVLPVSRGSR